MMRESMNVVPVMLALIGIALWNSPSGMEWVAKWIGRRVYWMRRHARAKRASQEVYRKKMGKGPKPFPYRDPDFEPLPFPRN